MRFDLGSFAVGLVSGLLIALGIYRSRGVLQRLRQRAQESVSRALGFLSAPPEVRYAKRAAQLFNAYHIAGDLMPLSALYVEPQLLAPYQAPEPSDEESTAVAHLVPIVHDFPAAYAPYNVETLNLLDLQKGERHLALLARSGMGKSTTLALLGLYALGEIELTVIDTSQDEHFERSLANRPAEERERLRRQYQENQRRALEKLKARFRTAEESSHQAADFRRMLPILVHLRDIDVRPEAYGVQPPASPAEGADGAKKRSTQSGGKAALKPLDPAEPIVKALQMRFGGAAASRLPKLVYRRLAEGTCLVLIDGYDELPEVEKPAKLTWLRQFMALYGANFVIVAADVNGYAPLLNIGFQACYLRAWREADYNQLADRWAAAWVRADKRAAAPDPKQLARAKVGNRGRPILDITLKIWSDYANDLRMPGRLGWYDFFVRRALPDETLRPIVQQAAAEILNGQGAPLSRERLKALLSEAFTDADGKPTRNLDAALNKLLKSPLLVEQPPDQYSFVHPMLTAYLAAERLEASELAPLATQRAWMHAMPFAAIRLPMDAAVSEVLNAPPDLLYTPLFNLAYWLMDAPSEVGWRAEFFKRVGGGALLATSQYPLLRERAMAALVTTRDNATAAALFLRALEHPDPLVRRLGCIGLGALGDSEYLQFLKPLLNDSDRRMRLACSFALGAIGTEAALNAMAEGLLQRDRDLQRAIAEALAALPDQGHALLREAIESDDLELRYAAVFGLARIRAAWAIARIYRTQLEDPEAYVRIAAEQAFNLAENPDRGGIKRLPRIDQIEWLVAWMSERGESIPSGENAPIALLRSLQEGDREVRAAAARTLGEIGYVNGLKALYKALSDQDEAVRAEAYAALGMLQQRVGSPLPAVL
ncbi:MAG: HEAT repeat domain-containing protein [Chloroflexi bacterium]|nr:HEAT repeat domain-containing protein [Chloroflexota bacterium]